jgi:AcrR family transcriptional regulator
MTKAERTRQFIIEQSAPIFNTKGLAATAMSDIMAATKMAKGGLYGHFESKEALAHSVVDYNLNKLIGKIEEAITKAPTAREKLFAYIDLHKNPLLTPIFGGCPLINFGMEADDTDPVVREKVKRTLETGQRIVEDIIKQGIKKGEFKDSFNAKEFSIKMFALIEGGIIIGRIMESNSQMNSIVKMLKKEIEAQAR